METIGRQEIESLVRSQEGPAISIYMPVSRIGDPQDPIRYKNLLAQAEKKLVNIGVRPAEARKMLEPEYAAVRDPDYWMHLGSDGLAVFRSGTVEARYPLPLAVREHVVVGRRFYIKPLVPLLTNDHYLVLALSKNELRLFHGDRYQVREIEVPEGTPRSMAEALPYDDPESQLLYHTQSGQGGRGRAMYHGQGVGIDEEKENLERYFQAVDRSLFPLLEDEKFPIVLAGAEELHAIYQGITRSRTILPGGITGNVKDLPPEELQRRAWDIAGRYFAEAEKEAERNFRENRAGGRAVDELQSVLAAAYDGRVDTLFVAENEEIWGIFEPGTREVDLREGDDAGAVDLLDQAVAWTLNNKGRIYLRQRGDMPVDSALCAILRY